MGKGWQQRRRGKGEGEGEEPEPREGSWWPRHPVGGREAGGLRDASEVSQGPGTRRQMRGLEGAGCRSSSVEAGVGARKGKDKGAAFEKVLRWGLMGSEDVGDGLGVWDPVQRWM